MKLILTLFTMVMVMVMVLAITPSAQADPYTGYYSIANVISGTESGENEFGPFTETYQDGETGRLTVYLNGSNKLRIRGYIDTLYEGRLPLRGRVSSKGKIIITKIGGEAIDSNVFNSFKIIKRGGIVVGLKGSGTDSGEDEFGTWDDVFKIVGYKTKNLPK